jgi:hypothetical protein
VDGSNTTPISFVNQNGYGIYANSGSIPARGNTLDFASYDYTAGAPVARNVMTLRPEGTVGINTTAPAATLDVNGTARINANTYLSGEVGLMPLLMNSSGVIKTPVVSAFSFSAGGDGSAQGPTMASITGNTGIYGVVASGAGSGSLYFAFYNTSSGALSNIFSTQADGFSVMFTITGGRLTWNYRSLPSSSWVVSYRVIPIISY